MIDTPERSRRRPKCSWPGRHRGVGRGHARRLVGRRHRAPQEQRHRARRADRHPAAATREAACRPIEVLSIAPLLAEALSAVFDDTSVSEIFGRRTWPSADSVLRSIVVGNCFRPDESATLQPVALLALVHVAIGWLLFVAPEVVLMVDGAVEPTWLILAAFPSWAALWRGRYGGGGGGRAIGSVRSSCSAPGPGWPAWPTSRTSCSSPSAS